MWKEQKEQQEVMCCIEKWQIMVSLDWNIGWLQRKSGRWIGVTLCEALMKLKLTLFRRLCCELLGVGSGLSGWNGFLTELFR